MNFTEIEVTKFLGVKNNFKEYTNNSLILLPNDIKTYVDIEGRFRHAFHICKIFHIILSLIQ